MTPSVVCRSLGEAKSGAQLKVVELMRKLSSLEKENLVLPERGLLLDGTGQVRVLQRDNDLLKTQVGELERELNRSKKLSRELQDENELRIKSEGSENKKNPADQTRNEGQSNATIQRLRDRNQHLEAELDSAEKYNRVAKEEIKQLEKENEDLRMEVERLNKRCSKAALVRHASFPKEDTTDKDLSGKERVPSQESQISGSNILPSHAQAPKKEIRPPSQEGEAGESTTPSWCSPPVPEPSKNVEDPPLQRLVRVESVYNGAAPFSQRSTEFQSNANSLSKAQVHVLVARGRVVTEEQAQISETDLKTFEEKYSFEFPGNMAVRSMEPHSAKEHASAFPTISSNLEDMVWREYHKMGINPAWKCLSDAEYAVATRHLELKREQIMEALPRDKQARYRSLHKTLAFHLHRSLPSPQQAPGLHGQRRTSSQELSFQQRDLNMPIRDDPLPPSDHQWDAVGPLAQGLVKQRSLLQSSTHPQHDPEIGRAHSLPIQSCQPDVPDMDGNSEEELTDQSRPHSPASTVQSETSLAQSSSSRTATSIGTRSPHAPQSNSYCEPDLDGSVTPTSPAVRPSLRIYGDDDDFDEDDSNSESATQKSWTSTQVTESQNTEAPPNSVQR
ncbi:hypothetical protein BSKO_08296 [Bryopsis sp. KO-2023]|nr:hypothetical protein BSKO_08296 [Bryopsis sp. KO-2023]